MDTVDHTGFMKNIFLLLLLFTLSCNKGSSDSSGSNEPAESSETTTDAVTPPVTNPVAPPTVINPPVVAPPVVVNPPVVNPPVEVPLPTLTWTDEFMDMVNNHRRSIGLRAIIHDDGLGDIARTHSQNMATGSVAFGHTGFSERCKDGRAELGGGNWCGENVAMGQKTPKDAFTSWMNSPGHKANIEQSRATHSGFGYVKSSSGKYYWTHIFLEL